MTSPVPATATSSLRALLNTPLRTVFEARLESQTQTWRLSSGSGGATQRVVTLRHNDTVGMALTKLARHRGGLTGAPVTIEPDPLRADCMDHGSRVDRDDGYDAAVLLGFFDTGDALRALIDALPDEDRKRATGEIIAPTRNVLAWMKLLEQMEKGVTNRRLVQVLGDDAELLYRPNLRGVTLGEAVREGFLHNKSANGFVHRLAIFDEKGEVTRVFSMSDAVRYLALRSDDMGGLEDMTLAELGLGQDTERLVTVDPSCPAVEAFARMCRKGVSGVGVLDKTQGLIANLSASDLRGVTPEHFTMLGLPVAEFLALLHGTSYAASRTSNRRTEQPILRQRQGKGQGARRRETRRRAREGASARARARCAQNLRVREREQASRGGDLRTFSPGSPSPPTRSSATSWRGSREILSLLVCLMIERLRT